MPILKYLYTQCEQNRRIGDRLMKFSKLTKPELEEIMKNANFTDEEVEVFKLLVADKSLEEVSQRLLISKTTTSRRVADIKEKIERSRAMINKVPIWEKVTLTIDEAAEYSNIGVNKLREITNNPRCQFVMYVGKRRLIKRKEFEKYIAEAIEISGQPHKKYPSWNKNSLMDIFKWFLQFSEKSIPAHTLNDRYTAYSFFYKSFSSFYQIVYPISLGYNKSF